MFRTSGRLGRCCKRGREMNRCDKAHRHCAIRCLSLFRPRRLTTPMITAARIGRHVLHWSAASHQRYAIYNAAMPPAGVRYAPGDMRIRLPTTNVPDNPARDAVVYPSAARWRKLLPHRSGNCVKFPSFPWIGRNLWGPVHSVVMSAVISLVGWITTLRFTNHLVYERDVPRS
jgi:hypothetical protein